MGSRWAFRRKEDLTLDEYKAIFDMLPRNVQRVVSNPYTKTFYTRGFNYFLCSLGYNPAAILNRAKMLGRLKISIDD